MNYQIGDIVKYNNNILKIEKIDFNYVYFTIIKSDNILCYISLDEYYHDYRCEFENSNWSFLTDEEKLELL